MSASADVDSAAELKAVCQELDALLVVYMERLERYQSLQTKSVGHIKSGYLAITKARLNSGGIHLKAELTLEPLSGVSCDYQPGKDAEDELSGRYEHRRVVYKAPESKEATNDVTPTTHRRVAHEDVREDSPSRRDDETSKLIDTDPTDMEKPTPTTTIAKKNDPLSAFGFMARNVLRPAQTQFNSALSHLLDAADAVQELKLLERNYMKLLEKKKALSTKA